MFDFTIKEITTTGNAFCGWFFFIILFLFWSKCTSRKQNGIKKMDSYILFFLIFGFVVTSWYTGDFFGYMANVESYYPGIKDFHLEKVYEYIIEFTDKNYLLFRVVVWGTALLVFTFVAKNNNTNIPSALFFMFLLYVTIFSYARVTLAMCIYFFGLTIFSSKIESRNVFGIICGLAIILSSYLFHKSMLVVILLTVFYYVPITKKSIIPILAFAYFMGLGIDEYMNIFMNNLLDTGDLQLTEKIEYNLKAMSDNSRQSIDATLFGWIMIIWQYFILYYPFIIISKIVLQKKNLIDSKSIIGLYRISFSIIVLATSLLIFSSSSLTYFYRYLYMSFIPISIMTIYFYHHKLMSVNQYRSILYFCGGYNIYIFFVSVIKGF